eukprot:Skav230057  [mRNA]  locus=scaffold1221:97051:97794:- [translate_table: standard]
MLPAPATHGRPMPRATTAAWLVIPPATSGGQDPLCCMQTMDVIRAGLDTNEDHFLAIFASSHGFITLPPAAPGEAGRPLAMICFLALGSRVGCKSWSIKSGFKLRRACDLVIKPSLAMSTAICRAAGAVRFPLRVCNM